MDKLKMHSRNQIDENLARLREVFPGCVTEARREDGSVTLEVDFDQLRQELSALLVEGPQERYHLNWPGKRKALLTANEPIAMALRPVRDESVDFDTTKNLFIEGDNLHALKLLQEAYLGQVKVIYIDPPYNTGNDFIYEDDFSESPGAYLQRSNQKDAQGNRLVANPSSNGRFHSDWLSMIYPRLRIARNLLADDGVMFISIGDDEMDNLVKLVKEVFGEDNFITTLLRQRKKKPSFLHSNIGSMFEYVVCVARNRSSAPPLSVDVTTAGKKYPLNNAGNALGVLNFPPGSVRFADAKAVFEPQDMSEGNIVTHLLDRVDVVAHTNTGPFRLQGEFRYSQARLDEIIAAGERITISKAPFRPNHVKAGGEIKKMHNLLTPDTYGVGTNEDGSAELQALFGSPIFDNPKPSSLVRVLCQAVTYDDPDAIVMDFFAGSGSTADAVMQLNASDGGNRRFVVVQLPESCDNGSDAYAAGYRTIADVCKERIRRAGTKLLAQQHHADWKKDVGFRVFRIDSSNMADVFYAPDVFEPQNIDLFVDNIKTDRTDDDLLFQVMQDWGVDLSLSVDTRTIQGKKVHFVDNDAIAACFAPHGAIDEDFVKELATHRPGRAVFRDGGFRDSAAKINADQIFKLLSPGTELKVI